MDWNAMIETEKERLEREAGVVSLELAVTEISSTRHVDLTTSLDHDIKYRDKDGQIKVLYPKGFVFNPLEHMQSSDIFVILDGTGQVELLWYESTYISNNKLNVYPIVSKGNVIEISMIPKSTVNVHDMVTNRFTEVYNVPTALGYIAYATGNIENGPINDPTVVGKGDGLELQSSMDDFPQTMNQKYPNVVKSLKDYMNRCIRLEISVGRISLDSLAHTQNLWESFGQLW